MPAADMRAGGSREGGGGCRAARSPPALSLPPSLSPHPGCRRCARNGRGRGRRPPGAAGWRRLGRGGEGPSVAGRARGQASRPRPPPLASRTRVDDVHAGQAARGGDLLEAQVLFDGDRVVRPALDRRVVGRERRQPAVHAAYAGHDAAGGHGLVAWGGGEGAGEGGLTFFFVRRGGSERGADTLKHRRDRITIHGVSGQGRQLKKR